MPKVRVDFLGDSGSLERALKRSSAAARVFGADISKAAARAESAQKGLKGSISPGVGLAAGIAGAAVISGLRTTISAAANAQQVLGQTKVALEDTGKSWARYGDQITKAIDAQRKLGFDDEELLKTFSTFERRTKNVSRALELNALTADVARARYIDLASASTIVLKASLGQAGALRRIGIEAPKGATGLQLITLLTQKYGGAATAASKDAITANERLRVSIQNVEEQLGSGLLPVVASLADELSTSADNAEGLVKALQQITLPGLGNAKGFDLGKAFKIGIAATPGVNIIAGEGEILKRLGFGGDKAKKAATDAGKAFGEAFGLAALEAAGKAATSKPIPFGEPGFRAAKPEAVPLPGPSVEQRNTIFDNGVSRALFRAGGLKIEQQLAALRKVAANLTARIAVTKDITRKLNLEDQLISVVAQQKDLRQQLAQQFTDALQFDVDRAGATKSLVDDLAALKRVEANLRERLAGDKTNLDLRQQIFAVQQQESDIVEQQRQNRIDRTTARQFRELGLGADGNPVTPGVANLKKRVGSFEQAVKGTFLDTAKTKNQLARFRKVLSEALVPKDVRAKFAEMLDDLNQQLKDHASGPLTRTTQLNTNRIISGVAGLTPDQIRQIRANSSHFNSEGVALAGSGATNITIPVSVMVDGRVVAKASAKYNRRTSSLNAPQRNGPHPGGRGFF